MTEDRWQRIEDRSRNSKAPPITAMNAHAIVAQPGTITGSIGVVFGKFVMRDLWKRLGVEWDSLQIGRASCRERV